MTEVSKKVVVRAVGLWLPSHCAMAKSKLRMMLGLPSHGTSTPQADINSDSNQPELTPMLRVRVETVAGVLVAQFGVGKSATVKEVKMHVATLAPQFPVDTQQLLLAGYEKHGVLKDHDVLQSGVAAIVGAQSQASTETETFARDTEICLWVAVQTVRWSRSRSNQTLVFSENNQRIKRMGNLDNFPCGVGTIRLTKPGHCFTVRVCELPRSPNCLSIGIGCENGKYRVTGGLGIGREQETIGLWFQTVGGWTRTVSKPRVRVLGLPAKGPELKVCDPGDQFTFTLGSGSKGLTLTFALNSSEFYQIEIPPTILPPFVPLSVSRKCNALCCQAWSSGCDGVAVPAWRSTPGEWRQPL